MPGENYDRLLARAAAPLDGPGDLQPLIDRLAPSRIVMLGEATHGTSEFYNWRRVISERLISDHGFSFIAVEGDWPDCQRVHEHITRGKGAAREALAGYRRFPTWMWGNEEVVELVEWMRGFGDASSRARRRRPAGFHGLDVYSLHDSMRLVIDYLRRVDPRAAATASRAYGCFDSFGADPQRYAYATRLAPENCRDEVVAALSTLERQEQIYSRINPDHTDPREAYFDAAMNARVTRNAEAYYRTMLGGGAASWNIRDQHMLETLDLLLAHYGPKSKAIVWAHNTHIGDYRATDMLATGYVNLGGLARQQYGDDSVALVGFSTHHGRVMAASAWDEPGEIMTVPAGAPGSLEARLHDLGLRGAMLQWDELSATERRTLSETVGHRAISVVYDPDREWRGNYVPTKLSGRYDALLFIDETEAVHALDIPVDAREEPEAYPTGL
jgi:erythromycin esterase-like protein